MSVGRAVRRDDRDGRAPDDRPPPRLRLGAGRDRLDGGALSGRGRPLARRRSVPTAGRPRSSPTTTSRATPRGWRAPLDAADRDAVARAAAVAPADRPRHAVPVLRRGARDGRRRHPARGERRPAGRRGSGRTSPGGTGRAVGRRCRGRRGRAPGSRPAGRGCASAPTRATRNVEVAAAGSRARSCRSIAGCIALRAATPALQVGSLRTPVRRGAGRRGVHARDRRTRWCSWPSTSAGERVAWRLPDAPGRGGWRWLCRRPRRTRRQPTRGARVHDDRSPRTRRSSSRGSR